MKKVSTLLLITLAIGMATCAAPLTAQLRAKMTQLKPVDYTPRFGNSLLAAGKERAHLQTVPFWSDVFESGAFSNSSSVAPGDTSNFILTNYATQILSATGFSAFAAKPNAFILFVPYLIPADPEVPAEATQTFKFDKFVIEKGEYTSKPAKSAILNRQHVHAFYINSKTASEDSQSESASTPKVYKPTGWVRYTSSNIPGNTFVVAFGNFQTGPSTWQFGVRVSKGKKGEKLQECYNPSQTGVVEVGTLGGVPTYTFEMEYFVTFSCSD